ncbi:MAG: SDR family oxidoreductase [Verrucomicrobia bacterium]|nr:SDR family oxidoreductase [Verrucomicrobiota bacterium]
MERTSLSKNHRFRPVETLFKIIVTSLAVAIVFVFRSIKGNYRFADKVVIITGGSRGLGLAIAREFAKEKTRIAILAREEPELDEAKSELLKNGVEVQTFPCDLYKQEEISSAINAVAQHFGRIDLLVNNAGEIVVGPLATMSTQDFEEAMKIHFWAPYYTISAATPYLRQQSESRIVNIASVGGAVAVPHLAPYCASKFALVGLSDALRAELDKEGTRVTTVIPGLMRTGSHVNAQFKGSNKKEFTWFTLGMANPFLSVDPAHAARQIVEAARRGQSVLTITGLTKLAIISQALMPNFTATILKFINRFLPSQPSNGGTQIRSGWESRVKLGILTRLADKAIGFYNENISTHGKSGGRPGVHN